MRGRNDDCNRSEFGTLRLVNGCRETQVDRVINGDGNMDGAISMAKEESESTIDARDGADVSVGQPLTEIVSSLDDDVTDSPSITSRLENVRNLGVPCADSIRSLPMGTENPCVVQIRQCAVCFAIGQFVGKSSP